MDISFLHQLFLAKLEDTRHFGELLENKLTTDAENKAGLSSKELENWLMKLDKWQMETAAFTAHTSRLNLISETTSRAINPGSVKKGNTSLASTFEGVEVKREIINKNGPMLSAGYHPERQVLDVEFKPGTVYRYYSIPDELWEQLLEKPRQAMSFFSKNIRNKYEFKQLPA